MSRDLRRWAWAGLGLVPALLCSPGTLQAQKTDVVTLSNGNLLTGEMHQLKRGQLKYKTDALKTVYVEWPRVVTVNTTKHFYIELDDGARHYGSLRPGTADTVLIVTDSTPVAVPTQSIVWLERLKSNFFNALDGSLNVGFSFTQQNAKMDFNVNWDIRYARLSNLTELNFDSKFSQQDGTEDIVSLSGTLAHARQLKNRWFYLGFLMGNRNSQLSLEGRGTVGGGVGRLLVEANRMVFLVWAAPGVSAERYTGEDWATAIPLALSGRFDFFIWQGLNTDMTTELTVMPMLNDLGRWRVDFTASISHELLKHFTIGLDITEQYDSSPPAAGANKNAFTFSTTIGWTY